MPAGRRRSPYPSRELIIPLALGLTAAIASVGLYLWPDTESSYSSSSSEDERDKARKRRRSKTPRLEAKEQLGRVTEEDTDDLEEDRRRDEERLRRGKQSTVMSGAMQLERTVEHTIMGAAGKAKELAIDVLPARKEAPAVREIKREAAQDRPQYVPPPAKKKSVAIVVSERKALEGHDSDSDFEEAGLPSVYLSHPRDTRRQNCLQER